MKKLIIFILTLSILLSTFSISSSVNEINNEYNYSLNKETIGIHSDEPDPKVFQN